VASSAAEFGNPGIDASYLMDTKNLGRRKAACPGCGCLHDLSSLLDAFVEGLAPLSKLNEGNACLVETDDLIARQVPSLRETISSPSR
jgi:hypothetical protein